MLFSGAIQGLNYFKGLPRKNQLIHEDIQKQSWEIMNKKFMEIACLEYYVLKNNNPTDKNNNRLAEYLPIIDRRIFNINNNDNTYNEIKKNSRTYFSCRNLRWSSSEKSFRENYKKNNGSKENSPIAYEALQKLNENRTRLYNLNFFALNSNILDGDIETTSFILTSMLSYSLLYVPFYYFFAREILDYLKSPTTNLFALSVILIENIAIYTKFKWLEYSVHRHCWFKNSDQKYISLILWTLMTLVILWYKNPHQKYIPLVLCTLMTVGILLHYIVELF